MVERRPNRNVRRTIVVVTALLAIATALMLTGALREGGARGGRVQHGSYATSLTTVARGSLSSQLNLNGMLTYATQADGSAYTIVNQAVGIYSQFPTPGRVVTRGQILYRVSNDPVVLLYGHTPIYRSLVVGDSGPDVRQLNRNLVALGYDPGSIIDPSSDHFDAATAAALTRLQNRLGEAATGALEAGQAVFLPGPIRIAAVHRTLGTRARRGAALAMATSTVRNVVANIDASDQTAVKVGDRAQITLPTGQRISGTVSTIGNVTGSSSGPIVPVSVTLKRPGTAGTLAQAPVQVEITTAVVKHALVVPVAALMARSGGRYAVETVDASGLRHLAAVTLGMFDDADGTVQVAGRLRRGERIVVPNV